MDRVTPLRRLWRHLPLQGRIGLRLSLALLLGLATLGASPAPLVNHAAITGTTNPPTLSTFGFFDGAPDRPAPLLVPYGLRSALFSDYADKHRWVVLPPGGQMRANGDGLLSFPVGTAIIKSFGYAQADGSYRTIETRLLLHRASGWVALPYIWRADGSDADLRLAGGRVPVTFTDPAGEVRTISYAVPNRNQCLNCHQLNGAMTPIGPQLRNLDLAPEHRRHVAGADWRRASLPRWDDASAPLEGRARAYLEINCAHCHRPGGSASNSGLYLDYAQSDAHVLGLYRRPTAAGRGSGGRDFDIAPGHAEQSIMIYRMDSTDPGIAMPELGRATVHREGLALLRDWIDAMPADRGRR
jgi:uncharacterized repeat protein (TIGR03806 family)